MGCVAHGRLAYVHSNQDEGTSQYLAVGEEENLVGETQQGAFGAFNWKA